MKRLVLLLCCILVSSASGAEPAELAGVETVYVLPMGGGLDQFLASQLTVQGVLRVVADPQKADAVFTDKLGKELQVVLDELFPPEGAKTGAAKEPGDQKAADAQKDEERRVQVSTLGRGKGTLFLVDRKTRAVLWSTYAKPKNATPDELNKAAARIVERLKAK